MAQTLLLPPVALGTSAGDSSGAGILCSGSKDRLQGVADPSQAQGICQASLLTSVCSGPRAGPCTWD